MATKTKIRIIQRITGCSFREAQRKLIASKGDVLELSRDSGIAWEIAAEHYFADGGEN